MFENFSPELIKKRMTDSLTTDIDICKGSFANDIFAPVALELWKIYASLDAIASVFYPDENSGEYIDKRCGYYGITRKEGTKATVKLTITGTNGKVVPKGTAFLNAESLIFITDDDAK